jgi:aryl-alcohol dehydrogenase-like predicted oxidoreductase
MPRLGRTDVELSAIGLGCWQFSEGFGIVGGFWPALPQPLVNEIVQKSLAGGINWFDTAEAYGNGRSEQALSQALIAAGKKPGEVFVATKWQPIGRFAGSLRSTIDTRVAKLSPFPIDLHQVHQPWGFSSAAAEMNAMADVIEAKKVRFAGVSNFSEASMRRAHAALEKRGLKLSANQVRYSLLDRRIEKNGVLAAAKELGITIIAYSPLAQGLLSGKFHRSGEKAFGPRKLMPAFRKSGLEKSRPLVDELEKIAQAHGSTSSQVALAWLIQFHGDTVVAIPGATKARHVDENVGAMKLKLSPQELERIDTLSKPFI